LIKSVDVISHLTSPLDYGVLADRTQVGLTAELLAWLSASVRLSVTDVLWLNGARYGLGCY